MAFVCGYWLLSPAGAQGYGELPPEKVADFITLAAIFGVMLGGRLGWVLFYGLDKVRAHPLDAFKLWEGGMASHGGILGLVIFTWVYARWQKVSWPGIGDNLVVVAPIGLFFGRVANFINGELWGRVITAAHPPPWAMQFPKELDAAQPDWSRARTRTIRRRCRCSRGCCRCGIRRRFTRRGWKAWCCLPCCIWCARGCARRWGC